MKILSKIDSPKDLKTLTRRELSLLASEIRQYIIDIVSEKKGHLGAGLGVVELTLAIHYVYNTPEDILIWDVGHQAYPHKIITGRREAFKQNRQKNGLSGFPRRSESPYDAFGTGHSSTSISALLGMAIAAGLKGLVRKHIAVIGDASIAAGMAFEALNHTGVTQADVLVILNDNEMGIDPHVGALKNYLTQIKTQPSKDTHNLFENLNFQYFGPIDGHNLPELIDTLSKLKDLPGPKFLHVITTKGKGLPQAEKDQITYHAPGIFDKKTGEIIKENLNDIPPKYQDVFGLTLVELAQKNKNIVGITPAMPTGTSLKYMLESFPERSFDVGIAEQHALTFAAGLATQGFIPYVAIYSTFLQRAYDQLIHDIAVQDLPVVICIDRAGIVGRDGATHHGVFDLGFMQIIPRMIIAAPIDEIELRHLLYTSQFTRHPFAIRYPRGRGVHRLWQRDMHKLPIGKAEQLREGTHVAILSLGHPGNAVRELLDENPQYPAAHYNMRFLKPLDTHLLHSILSEYDHVITVEDAVVSGGLGSAVSNFATSHAYCTDIRMIGIPDRFLSHGSIEELQEEAHMNKASILEILKHIYNS
jgi:1-deoxy-D-xylulose-5-phosphate synthase